MMQAGERRYRVFIDDETFIRDFTKGYAERKGATIIAEYIEGVMTSSFTAENKIIRLKRMQALLSDIAAGLYNEDRGLRIGYPVPQYITEYITYSIPRYINEIKHKGH